MYDAIHQVCEEKMMSPASLGRRHAMVIITDWRGHREREGIERRD